MDRSTATAEEYGMKINTKKDKRICKGEPRELTINLNWVSAGRSEKVPISEQSNYRRQQMSCRDYGQE